MEDNSPEGIIHESKKPQLMRVLYLALLLFVVSGIGIFLWWWTPILFVDKTPVTPPPITEIEIKAPPTGDIYMSLVPFPTETNPIGIYRYSIDDQQIYSVATSGDPQNLTSKFSPDGTRVAYATAPSPLRTDVGRLYVADVLENGELGEHKEVFSDEDLVWRRNPNWSPDGKYVAYIGKVNSGGDGLDVEDRRVYVSETTSGEEHFITTGTNPLFVPDGRLLVLKEDGLHLFTIDLVSTSATNSTNTRVWSLDGGEASGNMKLDVSPDGRYIAWSVINHNQLIIIEVNSWDPFQGELAQILPSAGFWPVFSPDSNYLAFEEVNGVNDITNQRLVLFDLETFEKTTLFDLTPYYQEALFITDWR